MITIGKASKESGVSVKMIRYYESIGLIDSVSRTEAGYRTYSDDDIRSLRFVKRSRTLGFSLEQIDELLSLWRDEGRSSSDVKILANNHIIELEAKIKELNEMCTSLKSLATLCSGDKNSDCPILKGLDKK